MTLKNGTTVTLNKSGLPSADQFGAVGSKARIKAITEGRANATKADLANITSSAGKAIGKALGAVFELLVLLVVIIGVPAVIIWHLVKLFL